MGQRLAHERGIPVQKRLEDAVVGISLNLSGRWGKKGVMEELACCFLKLSGHKAKSTN